MGEERKALESTGEEKKRAWGKGERAVSNRAGHACTRREWGLGVGHRVQGTEHRGKSQVLVHTLENIESHKPWRQHGQVLHRSGRPLSGFPYHSMRFILYRFQFLVRV